MAGKQAAAAIQQYIKTNSFRFDKVLDKLKIISAGHGGCIAELKIEKEHTNINGTLHGGLSATLIDTIGSYGLLTHEDCCVPGVTVDLQTRYLKGASIGEEILVDSKAVKTGKTIAYMEVLITNKKSGQRLVSGVLTRYLMRPRD